MSLVDDVAHGAIEKLSGFKYFYKEWIIGAVESVAHSCRVSLTTDEINEAAAKVADFYKAKI